MLTSLLLSTALLAAPQATSVMDGVPPANKMMRVSAKAARTHIKTQVPPVYPSEAKAKKVEGIVVLGVVIDEGGNVKDVKIIAGHPALRDASVTAVKQWKYEPFLLNGSPIAVQTTVNISYLLERKPEPDSTTTSGT